MRRRSNSRSRALLLSAALGAGAVERAAATDYTITTLADGVAADGTCTLREAIRAAATGIAVHECPAGGSVDRIVLAAIGDYSFSGGQELLLSENLTIRGGTGEAGSHRIDLRGQNRFLLSLSSVLTLEDITVANGGPASMLPDGGGVSALSSTLRLARVVFEGCRAVLGGGLAIIDGSTTLDGVIFRGNRAEATNPGGTAAGGGLYVELSATALLTAAGLAFEGNVASSVGAKGLAQGGAVALAVRGRAELRDLAFVGNTLEGAVSNQGGGLRLALDDSGEVIVEDLAFEGNGAEEGAVGQALFVETAGESTAALRRLRIAGNGGLSGIGTQGELSLRGVSTLQVESALVAHGADRGLSVSAFDQAVARLGSLTVAHNSGEGLVLEGLSASPIRVENSILWGNVAPGSTAPDLAASGLVDVDRAANHNWIGNLGDPDPFFVDAVAGDFSLAIESEAIDAGDQAFQTVGSFDTAHAPRVAGIQVDLGAFERDALFGDDFESAGVGFWSAAASGP